MSPLLSSTVSPPLTSPSSPVSPRRQLSNTSLHNLATLIASASSSRTSLRLTDIDGGTIKVEGLRHARMQLQAKHYKTPDFASGVFEILRVIRVPYFNPTDLLPRDLVIRKVSGALTNAVFFVSFPSSKSTRTVLLRIYGPSSGSLISRPRELHTLHILSSVYHIGPRVYGTFDNGRVEQYFESTTLTAQDIRDPKVSQWIAARMAEFHSVDVAMVEGGEGWEIGVEKSVRSWLVPAREVLALPSLPENAKRELALDTFCRDWDKYRRWLASVDDVRSGSRRVFAHNDTQYGNLLRLKRPREGADDHRQIIVVDFEYAGPNPASYDIANLFHEWTADYHSDTPHLLETSRYPTLDERRNFYLAYLRHTSFAKKAQHVAIPDAELESMVSKLEGQVQAWSPASHASWALWAIVQARDDLENDNQPPEFDYIAYAGCRMALFRRELIQLGVLPHVHT